MNDMAIVGILHGLEHLQKQLQALADVEAFAIAPLRQQPALHILHRQIRQAVGIDPRIVEARDMRMLQARQDVALARKTLLEMLAHPGQQRQFERHLAEQSNQLVRTHMRAGSKSGRRRSAALGAGGGRQRGIELGEQCLAQLGEKVVIFRRKRLQPAPAAGLIQGQSRVEQAAHRCHSIRRERHSHP